MLRNVFARKHRLRYRRERALHSYLLTFAYVQIFRIHISCIRVLIWRQYGSQHSEKSSRFMIYICAPRNDAYAINICRAIQDRSNWIERLKRRRQTSAKRPISQENTQTVVRRSTPAGILRTQTREGAKMLGPSCGKRNTAFGPHPRAGWSRRTSLEKHAFWVRFHWSMKRDENRYLWRIHEYRACVIAY